MKLGHLHATADEGKCLSRGARLLVELHGFGDLSVQHVDGSEAVELKLDAVKCECMPRLPGKAPPWHHASLVKF